MSTLQTELSTGQVLPWAKMMLDYTDDVVKNLPEDDAALDWRPTDASGGWYFSIREQAMHIADTRHNVISRISGEDTTGKEFCTEYGGVAKPWQFNKACRAEILESLKAGRAAVDDRMAKPASQLLETTPSLVKEHDTTIEKMRADGKDTAEREARGPGLIINTLLFLVAHEQSHRSVLQTMLRQRGHEVTRYA